MKHAATLLIKDIHKIYTMQADAAGNDIIISHAFLAIYHDKILHIGIDGMENFIDSATRIINGSGCIAIPGIIDSDVQAKPLLTPYLFEHLEIIEEYYEAHPHELIRDMHSLLFQMMLKGITTFAYSDIPPLYEEVLLSLKKHPYEFFKTPNISLNEVATCHYHYLSYPCIDPFYQARMLFQQGELSQLEIMKRFTKYPAAVLNCPHLGVIEEDKQADILLLEGSSLEFIFQQINMTRLRSVIKKGTQQFPCLLI